MDRSLTMADGLRLNYNHGVTLSRRLIGASLLLGLLTGRCLNPCAGWAFSQEARMACCAKPDGDNSQSSADACCAVTEQRRNADSSPSAPAATLLSPVAGLSLFAVLPDPQSCVECSRSQHEHAGSAPDTHLLLSVFLI
jgi:hypothetical protein